MSTQPRTAALYVWGSILVAGLLPLALYWPAFKQPLLPESVVIRNIGAFEQWLVVITAFGVKPAYMLLSLIWIIWLWRRQATDLVALRWGLIFFLGGETACAANYILFAGNSALTDYLHSYGMAVGFSFVTYAILEGMDFRLIKYSPAKDRCAALSLCRACIKYATGSAGAPAGVSSRAPKTHHNQSQSETSPAGAPALPVCGLRRLFSFLIPALVVISLMLPCAAIKPLSHRINVLNSVQDFPTPMWAQLFEGHYCAWISVVLLLVSWGVLSFKRKDPVAVAKIFFAAAMGPLGFGLMRLFLRTAYREDLAWANIWEELTELIFVAGVGLVLWLFRGALFREELLGAPASLPASSITNAHAGKDAGAPSAAWDSAHELTSPDLD